MTNQKTVIVATDGSAPSVRLLPHASLLAQALGATLEVVRVVEASDLTREPGEDESSAAERARTRLDQEITADLTRFGIEGRANAVIAAPREPAGQALLRVSADAAVFAMHSRGRSGIARMLQGSVAMRVLQNIDQPVLLGGPELLPPHAPGQAYRLLITSDLSEDSDAALTALAPLLAQGNFHVTLLNVHLRAPQGRDNEAERASHEAQLTEKRQLLPTSTTVEIMMREIAVGGGIDTAILEVAAEVHADAIAMSTHGHSKRHHVLMGSTAMSLLGRSALPLMLVRAKD